MMLHELNEARKISPQLMHGQMESLQTSKTERFIEDDKREQF